MSGDFPIEMLDRRRFNRGGDTAASIQLRCEEETQQVLIRLPAWMVEALDQDAKQRGCSRNYLINLYLDESFRDDPDHCPVVDRFERVVDAHGCIVKQHRARGNALADRRGGGQ